jgi:hypothetical protein
MTEQDLQNEINWAPVSSYYYWSTDIQSAKVGEFRLPVSVNQVIYDSGASLCYLPTRDFKALIEEVTRDQKCISIDGTEVIC